MPEIDELAEQLKKGPIPVIVITAAEMLPDAETEAEITQALARELREAGGATVEFTEQDQQAIREWKKAHGKLCGTCFFRAHPDSRDNGPALVDDVVARCFLCNVYRRAVSAPLLSIKEKERLSEELGAMRM